MASLDVGFCADKNYKDKGEAKRNARAAEMLEQMLDPFTFPAWEYTVTEKDGTTRTFRTRARWINGKYWGDADIAYYEAMEAARLRFVVEGMVDAVEQQEGVGA